MNTLHWIMQQNDPSKSQLQSLEDTIVWWLKEGARPITYYQPSSGIKIEAGLSAQVKSQQH
jgi:hypothetical protein